MIFLKKQLLDMQMKSNESIQEFVSRINSMAEQIMSLSEEKVSNLDKSLILTRGVPEKYRMNIIALQELNRLNDFEHVATSLTNEEMRLNERKKGNGTQDTENAFYSNSRGHGRGRGGNRGNRGGMTNKFEGNCRYCGINGHKEFECRKKQFNEQGNNRGNHNNYGNNGNRGNYNNRGHHRGTYNNYGNNGNQANISEQIDDQSAFTANFTSNDISDQWVLDTGASQHMTSKRDLFTTYKKLDKPIKIKGISNQVVYAQGRGNIEVTMHIFGKNSRGTFMDVLHVPEADRNLISVAKVMQQKLTVQLEEKNAIVYRNGKPVLTATIKGNIYIINCSPISPISEEQVNIVTTNEIQLWHQRLGHISPGNLRFMIQNNSVQGLSTPSGEIDFCESCTVNKLTRLPFPSGGNRSYTKLHIVHSDICGPMKTLTHQGNRYFITFIDDFSRKSYVYFINSKDQAFTKFQEFKAQVENETGLHIKIFRTDRGGEYMGNEFKNYLKKHGIQHQLTAPYSPQQNGVAERFNRTVIEMAKTMLHNANLPYSFWAEAIYTATYIRNRCISRALDNKSITPEEIWTGFKPSVNHLRTFGCDAYALTNDYRHKLEPKAKKYIFVGYSIESKAYRLWCPERRKIIISRDVKFNENSINRTHIPSIETPIETQVEPSNNQTENETSSEIETTTTKPIKKSRIAEQLKSDLGSYWQNTDNNEEEITSLAFANIATFEPQTYQQAIDSPDASKWKQAMDEEYQSLLENKTWKLTKLPSNCTTIPTRWLFKVKHKGDGTIERYKARLVAKGFAQYHGTDYDETYSPVFKLTSLRILLSIGAMLDLEIHQMDVKTAFLNGEIDTDLYINQPQGYQQNPDLVCKLQKGLYGLKQSPRLWNKRIDAFLSRQNFQRCQTDLCVYRKNFDDRNFALFGIWVDDIVIISPPNHIETIKNTLKEEFKMSDLGPISYILGISVTRDRPNRTIHLHQSRYISDILERFNLTKCNPSSTPSDPSTRLVKPNSTNKIAQETPYRQAIGSLMYLMLATRPDISAALNKVAQFSNDYDSTHWIATKRILRYVKGTSEYSLALGGLSRRDKTETLTLTGSCDADWGGDLTDRRSTTGYVFLLNNHVISWKSHKQTSVATSSTEAEYQALSSATKEVLWLRMFMNEIGFEQQSPTTIQQDNQSTISLAHNPTHHNRTKHIDIAHHHIRECLEENKIDITYVPTSDIIADVMTKALSRAKFEHCRNYLNIARQHTS